MKGVLLRFCVDGHVELQVDVVAARDMGKLSRSMKLLALATTIEALQLPRRALPSLAAGVALAPALAPSRTHAAAEWAVGALQDKAWTISKRQESSVRIRPETMLVASDEKTDRELKVVKIPLGRAAASIFARGWALAALPRRAAGSPVAGAGWVTG